MKANPNAGKPAEPAMLVNVPKLVTAFYADVPDASVQEFNNGKYYYQFESKKLWMPSNAADRANREFLEWHADTVFQR